MTKNPKRIAAAAVIAMALGGVALGVALPAQASATHPASVTSTTGTQSDGETADDTAGTEKAGTETADDTAGTEKAGTEKADAVDGTGVEDGTKDGETADD